MSLASRIRDLFAPRIYRTYVYGQASAHIDDMDVEELYATQPQLRAVVSFIAANVAQLPLKVFIRESDTNRTRDTTSSVARLLAAPNSSMTTYELIYGLMSDLKLFDTALWLISEDADSDSGFSIRPIPPAWITGYEGGNLFEPERVVITNPETGVETPVDMNEAILWHGYDPLDPRYGISPIRSLRQTLKEQIEAWSYREQMWERASRIPAYISRSEAAEQWDDADMERFRDAWQDAYAKRGHGAGSMPVLEDGMKILASPSMSMQDAQWAQVNQLSLQTVCAAYHMKAGMLVDGEQPYASVKDNARALYTDCLGPDLKLIEQRLTRFLVKILGADPRTYIEFDLNEKLNGNFLDQVQALQSSVGAPWITRDEARAMTNRPALGNGADELIVPLNVVTGGLASPRDTTASSYASASSDIVEMKQSISEIRRALGVPEGPRERAALGVPEADPDLWRGWTRLEVAVEDEERMRLAETLKKFFTRQGRSVLPKMGAAEKAAGDPDWWDSERWDKELADDLYEVLEDLVARYGLDVMMQLADDPDLWDAPSTEAYVRAVADARAASINQTTLRALLGSMEPEATKSAKEVFDYAASFRSEILADMLSRIATGFAAREAVSQSGRGDVQKMWVVTSGNPRDSHAAMNGEVVPFDAPFSNGAKWPGDTVALDIDQVAGCQCRFDLLIP